MLKLLLLIPFLSIIQCYAQYCNIGGPTSGADSEILSVQLTGEGNSISHSSLCQGNLGVENYSLTQSTILNSGGTYTLNVQFGSCGGNYSGVGTAWIDYDGNFTFDPSEVIGTWVGMPPVALISFNFTVPIGAIDGQTRLRVTQQEQATLPLDPCATFQWGSVLDFGITIAGGVDCSSYLGDTKATAMSVNSLPFFDTVATNYCYYNQNLVYSSPDVYYKVITQNIPKNLSISLCGSNFDTFLSVVKNNGTVLGFNDDGSCGSASELEVTIPANDTAFIIVEGWGNNSGTYELTINPSVTGIDEFTENQLVVYPNPAEKSVFVSVKQKAILTISQLDGKQIKIIEDYFNEEISLENIPQGIYLINVLNKTSKLIVQ